MTEEPQLQPLPDGVLDKLRQVSTSTIATQLYKRGFHQPADDDWATAAAKRLPMGKLGQPDEIADFVVFLLSERSGVVTGSVIDWDQVVPGAYD